MLMKKRKPLLREQLEKRIKYLKQIIRDNSANPDGKSKTLCLRARGDLISTVRTYVAMYNQKRKVRS